jgi:YXWGXW repeat-containing protein
MKRLFTTIVLSITLLTAGEVFGQVSFGIRIGPPPPPRVVRVLPRRPGPDYTWIDGYWYPSGNHWKWHKGYWTRAPYAGARWYGPRYDGGQYYQGYWEGNRGRIEHEHRWDHDRYRDYRNQYYERH